MFDMSGKQLTSSNFNSFSNPGVSGPVSRISPFRNPDTGRNINFGSFEVRVDKKIDDSQSTFRLQPEKVATNSMSTVQPQ